MTIIVASTMASSSHFNLTILYRHTNNHIMVILIVNISNKAWVVQNPRSKDGI